MVLLLHISTKSLRDSSSTAHCQNGETGVYEHDCPGMDGPLGFLFFQNFSLALLLGVYSAFQGPDVLANEAQK